MAVADQTPYKEYVANGTTTIFPLEFDCDSADHLIVKKDDEVIPSLNNWSLDINTGSVIFNTAPIIGSKLILQRDTPLNRDTDYATYNNSIRPQPVNKDFDRIWLKLQELGVGDNLLKEFFIKEVESQGVAVGQLDELYNDFLQRLANVNTDKDWDAAFVAYRGSTQDIFNQNQENLNLTIINYVNPKMWGAIGDGIADDSDAVESCKNYMIANAATFNDFSDSKYRHTRNITFTAPNQRLTFNGNCEFVSDSFYITFTGTKTQIGYISVAASKNSKTITLNQNVSLNQNDLIAIHNSRVSSLSTHRSYYYDGEIREVESVSGNFITMKAQLESSYPSGVEDKVWKIEPIFLEINGITFTGNGFSAIKVSLAAKSSFNFNANNLQNTSGSQNAFYIDRCFDCHVKGGRYIKKGVSGTGTDYGILVSNSQDILVEADYAYGGRHGTAVGGDNSDMAVPCRRIYFEKIVIENDPTTTLHAADFHGNAIACHYKNCEIKGRVSLAGDSCKSIGNRITSPAGEVRSPIHLTEVIGGDVGSFGDTFLSTGIATTLMMWQTSTFLEKLSKPATFSMVDPIVEANASLIGLMSILNTNQACKYVLDGFAINGDVSTLNRLISYTTGTSAIKPVFIQITRPKTQLSESVVLLQGDVVLPNVAKSVFSQSGTDTVNNNGSWIKQSDGSMICRQRISVTGTINTAYAGGFKSTDITWTYPKAFVGVPTIIATSLDNACASIKALNPTSTATTLFGFATQSFASASVVIDVTAIGRHLT